MKPYILNRILLALGVNPHNELEIISWNNFLMFKKVIVNRDAPNYEIVDFVMKVIF